MSYKDFDQFDYIYIKPQNYKYKQNMSPDLDLITKTLENITNDWKERESSLQFIGRIVKGNQGRSDYFIKYFNTKLCNSLEIQLSDLRSTVMKEACRITSLCARELGLSIEQGITQLLTPNCLFKIAGSANQVISENASKCILNIIRYVHSLKVISNICEVKTMKANNVRILCAQSLVNIISFYDSGMINKAKNILEETIQALLIDANAEVRATTRRSFILYKNRFSIEGEIIFGNLGKSVQKTILEDEKNFDKFNISVKPKIDENFVKNVKEIIDENLNNIDNDDEQLKNKKKKAVNKNNTFVKKKSAKDFSRQDKFNIISGNNRIRKSAKVKRNTYVLDKEKEQKEETVKYINIDDDDIIENDDDIEEDKRGAEESKDLNMVLNYNNNFSKNKNNKMSFTKKNFNKDNEGNERGNNTKNDFEKESLNDDNNTKGKIIQKDNNKRIENNNLAQSKIINQNKKSNNNNANKIIDDLIINTDKLVLTNAYQNDDDISIQKVLKTEFNTAPERTKRIDKIKKEKMIITLLEEKAKANQNIENKVEKNKMSNNDKNHKVIKKFNTKYDKINAFKNYTFSLKPTNKSNNLKENKKRGKSKEKIKIIRQQINKNTYINNTKDINDDIITQSSKTIDYNTMDIKDIYPNKKENNKKPKNKKNDNIETVNIILDDERKSLDEEIDAVINIDKKGGNIKTNRTKTVNQPKDDKIINQEKNNLNKNDIKKNIGFNIFNRDKERNDKKKLKLDNKIENINYQDLYDELSNINAVDKNDGEETSEQKTIVILDKLDNLINQNEKLIIFQYLFNYFNIIVKEVKSFSQSTIKRYIDIHLENLKENDSNLVEQVLKNLMRMIFYLNDIFTNYDIELILKILLFSINDFNNKTLKKLSFDLLEIIKKRCNNEELFQIVYSLLGEYNSNYDECYEFMYLLIPSCDKILKNINYFKQVFRLICLTDINSKKVGKIIDILYRNYRNNFNQAFEEESSINKQKILMFMEKLNSLYYIEFKSTHINDNTNITNSLDNTLMSNKPTISSSIIKQNQKNNRTIKSIEDNNIKYEKESLCDKNSETNINTSHYNNAKTDSNISNSNLLNQSLKNNNNINTINANLKENNIISINNSNNNNIIITNKLSDYDIPSEINSAIVNNNLEQYLFYMQKHKSFIPEYILLLSNKKYSEQKYIFTLLNFTKNILNNSDFSIDLNTCINLMLKQLIHIFNSNKNNKKIEELINNIISEMIIYLNSEKCLSLMAKYLKPETDSSILEIIILSLENFVNNYKSNTSSINKEIKSLQNLLDYFVFEIFNLLKHQNSEIRKRALYCCLEIYTVLGKEFEHWLEKLPNAQQNLIRLYMKKRMS